MRSGKSRTGEAAEQDLVERSPVKQQQLRVLESERLAVPLRGLPTRIRIPVRGRSLRDRGGPVELSRGEHLRLNLLVPVAAGLPSGFLAAAAAALQLLHDAAWRDEYTRITSAKGSTQRAPISPHKLQNWKFHTVTCRTAERKSPRSQCRPSRPPPARASLGPRRRRPRTGRTPARTRPRTRCRPRQSPRRAPAKECGLVFRFIPSFRCMVAGL